MLDSAEFEDAVAAWRVEIKALCTEVRRLEGQRDRLSESVITIPAGWLPAVAEGLEWQLDDDLGDDADGLSDAEHETVDAESNAERERGRSLAQAIRDVEPGGGYVVDPCDQDALLVGLAGALKIQEVQLLQMPEERTRPRVLRFVALEQIQALGALFCLLWEHSD